MFIKKGVCNIGRLGLAVALGVLLGTFACSINDLVHVKKRDAGPVDLNTGYTEDEITGLDENEAGVERIGVDAASSDAGGSEESAEDAADSQVNRADSGVDSGKISDSGPSGKENGTDGGNRGTDSATPPGAIAYAVSHACYSAGKKITDNEVTVTGGAITSFTIAPALPAGLSFSTTTGTISGTAPVTESPLIEYTVTGHAPAGSTAVKIKIAICTPPSAHWAFDEGTGTRTSDSSGNGNHGTLLGTPVPTWTVGKIGPYALQFDGTNNYVEVGHAEVFNSPIFSLAAWLYSQNTLTAECSYFRRIGGWQVRTDMNGWDIRFETEKGSTVNNGAEYGFPSEQWHHYVVVVNDNDKYVKFYVDAVQIGDTRYYRDDFSDSNDNVYIGQSEEGFRWHGRIDDVRFYDQELTLPAIETLFQIGQ